MLALIEMKHSIPSNTRFSHLIIWSLCSSTQEYCRTVRVTNKLWRGAGGADTARQQGALHRDTFRATPWGRAESIAVTVQLRVLCFAAKKKAQEQGQRDNFRIKASPGSPICYS